MVSTNYPIASNSATHPTTPGPSSSSTSSVSAAGNSNLSTGPSPDSPLLNVPGDKTRASSRSPSTSASLSQHHYIVSNDETTTTTAATTTTLKTAFSLPSKPTTAKLCILSPNYSEPFYIHISLQHTSVAQLKTLLSQKHPGQPSPSDSRLVYRGHVLSDAYLVSEYLQDVVDVEKDTLINMHLVLGPTSLSATSHSLSAATHSVATSTSAQSKCEQPSAMNNNNNSNNSNNRCNLNYLGQFSDSISMPLTSIYASCLSDCDALAHHVLAFDPEPGQLFIIENLLYKYTLWNGVPYLIPVYEQYMDDGMGIDYHRMSQTTLPPTLRGTAEEEPAAAAPAAERAAEDAHLPRPGSIGLAIKLIFFLFIFTQKAGAFKTTILCLLTVFIFLHQTGRLVIVRRQPRTPRSASQSDATTDTTRQNEDDATMAQAERSTTEKIKTIVVSFLLSIIPAPGVPVDE